MKVLFSMNSSFGNEVRSTLAEGNLEEMKRVVYKWDKDCLIEGDKYDNYKDVEETFFIDTVLYEGNQTDYAELEKIFI